MEYDWEKNVDYDFIQEIAGYELPDGIALVSLCLGQRSTCRAA